jgi:uncharacterized membrane protein YgcG
MNRLLSPFTVSLLTVVSLVVVSFATASRAEEVTSLERPADQLGDRARLLNTEQTRAVGAGLRSAVSLNNVDFLICTVKTTDGKPIREFADEVATHWEVGAKNDGRGVVLVVAADDKSAAVGLGPALQEGAWRGIADDVIASTVLPEIDKSGAGVATVRGYIDLRDRIVVPSTPKPDEPAAGAAEGAAAAEGFSFPLVWGAVGGLLAVVFLIQYARSGPAR